MQVLATIETQSTDLQLTGEDKLRIDLCSRDGNLLAYIVENAPVSTSDILCKGFASRRQTFNLLRALERGNKIERVSRGLYIAL